MLKTAFENLRSRSPLIHNITNYVTVNDCANMVLACGASPIMADDAAEVEEITAICGGLNINIGTLNSRTVTSMLLAGKKANQLGHPVVLDPVGAGASHLRTDTAFRLLREVQFTVIRGNISEIKTLASGAGTTKGVDADVADKVTEENLDSAVAFAKAFAARTGAVVAITGAIDIVADAQKAYCIRNGHPMMSAITGTGCQLSALTAAFVTATTPLFYVVNSLYLLFTIAELALVFVLSARVQNMSVGAARGVFLGYALLNGMVLSYYFLAFDLGTLVLAFLATSLYFGLMAVYGTTTHKDLSGWGPKLMMALFALIITGFVGVLFGMGFMGTVLYSGIGLVVFMLLTAYDTQKLSQMYSYYAGDSELAEKASIYGALTLYLDFINIFLYILRMLGRRNND